GRLDGANVGELGLERRPVVALRDRRPERLDLVDQEGARTRALEVRRREALERAGRGREVVERAAERREGRRQVLVGLGARPGARGAPPRGGARQRGKGERRG